MPEIVKFYTGKDAMLAERADMALPRGLLPSAMCSPISVISS